MLPDACDDITKKNEVFGVDVYAPAAMCDSSARYAVLPDACELTVIKNDVFGVDEYAPASKLQLSPR